MLRLFKHKFYDDFHIGLSRMNRRPSPLDNEQCRQCTSFSDYVKVSQKKMKKDDASSRNISSQNTPTPPRTDCPLDRDELGRSSWGLLHTIASKYPDKPSKAQQNDIKEFFNLFAKLYPCEHCAQDLREDLKKDPPKVESYKAFSQWLCRLHNKVNVKIGKEAFDCSKVDERWRDGWKDGSCDF